MRVGLLGFGKTGKAVAAIFLKNKDFRLEWVIRNSSKLEHRSIPEFLGEDSDEPGLIYSREHVNIGNLLDQHPVDLIVDFSSETGVDYYGEEAAHRGIKIISAISHYPPEKKGALERLAQSTAVFWSPNITLGVNFLIQAAKFLKKIAPWVDMSIVEEHFREKAGVSGTAQVMARELELPTQEIHSIRAGGIIGRHEILCGFPFQTVRLSHESIAREAFGNGALFVAKNMQDKPSGFYTFEQILQPYFGSQTA